jgi:hypothetical protein
MPKLQEKMILTGCDANTEWQLPWFLENYYKHNSLSLAIADFGMSEGFLEKISKKFPIFGTMDMSKEKSMSVSGWFLKPAAMCASPSRSTCWIDTDCEILGNLEFMFRHFEPNKLNMVEDKPWSKRRGEVWHNSGVVGFIGKPEILTNWKNAVKENAQVGDQEVLHAMLNPITRMAYINDLPNEYNWLRLQFEVDGQDSSKKKIVHWTGKKGNAKIKEKIKAKELMYG